MSHALSKLFVKLNIGIYAVNFAVLFTVGMMLLSITGNIALYLLPGMFFVALVCLVYPDIYNVIGSLVGWESVTTPQPTQVFDQMSQIVNSALTKDYSAINPAFPTASFCAVLCWFVGIVCLFMQSRLLKNVSAPMDWYKKHALSTYVYAPFGVLYGILMCVGAFAVIGSPLKVSGTLLTFAWFFALCGIVTIAGVAVLIVERFLTVQTYNAMTEQEQIALCEKQSKYMNKRQRKKQIKKLGHSARYYNPNNPFHDEPTDADNSSADTDEQAQN